MISGKIQNNIYHRNISDHLGEETIFIHKNSSFQTNLSLFFVVRVTRLLSQMNVVYNFPKFLVKHLTKSLIVESRLEDGVFRWI